GGDEAIGWPELARFEHRWNRAGNRLQLLQRIELKVDLAGRRARVAKPERHLTDAAGGLEHPQAAGASQYGRGDRSPRQRWALARRDRMASVEDVLEPGASHVLAPRVHEELGNGGVPADGEPGANGVADALPEAELALLAPLAADEDVDIGAVKA